MNRAAAGARELPHACVMSADEASRPRPKVVEELFLACELRLGKFLRQMVRDPALAEDLLQDVFHDAYRGREELLGADNPTAWLYGMARNHALNALRRRRRGRHAVEMLAGRRRAEPDRDDQEILAVRDLLERHLSPEDRTLVLLRYLHGFDAIELAEMSGRSPAAVRQRLSRARRTLLQASGLAEERYGWEDTP
jgi:RNA polymerase sigma factor (sigma-70 family)